MRTHSMVTRSQIQGRGSGSKSKPKPTSCSSPILHKGKPNSNSNSNSKFKAKKNKDSNKTKPDIDNLFTERVLSPHELLQIQQTIQQQQQATIQSTHDDISTVSVDRQRQLQTMDELILFIQNSTSSLKQSIQYFIRQQHLITPSFPLIFNDLPVNELGNELITPGAIWDLYLRSLTDLQFQAIHEFINRWIWTMQHLEGGSHVRIRVGIHSRGCSFVEEVNRLTVTPLHLPCVIPEWALRKAHMLPSMDHPERNFNRFVNSIITGTIYSMDPVHWILVILPDIQPDLTLDISIWNTNTLVPLIPSVPVSVPVSVPLSVDTSVHSDQANSDSLLTQSLSHSNSNSNPNLNSNGTASTFDDSENATTIVHSLHHVNQME